MQEQVRKNFATFEKALGLFTPFAKAEQRAARTATLMLSDEADAETPARTASRDDEIATLKAELSAMQQRLEQLSRR